MHDCQFKSRLSAYHDAELSASEIEAINEHLPTCEVCGAELATIREVSGALATYQPEEISQIELARLHGAINRAAESGGVLRLAGMLGAIAASVLIICMAWMSQSPQPTTALGTPRPVPTWEAIASGEQIPPPNMPEDMLADQPHRSGVAAADQQTIDFMLNGIQGLNGHEGR